MSKVDRQKGAISLAITGASGAAYGLRLLDLLIQKGEQVYLMISKPAQIVIATETDIKLPSGNREIEQFLSENMAQRRGNCSSLEKISGLPRWPVALMRQERWWSAPVQPVRSHQSQLVPATH